jgi:bifunctional enzyme CysN/CysC
VPATITDIKYRTNVNTLEQAAANKLDLNEVGTVTIATDRPVSFDPYADNPLTGGFILIDRLTNSTLGAGTIEFGLRRAQNLTYQSFDVNRQVRAQMKGQEAQVVWFTGLSGSGKSTIANLLEKRLTAEGRHCYILDGDNVRHGLNRDLGFTEAARVENIRRVAEVAKLMADAGLIVLVSFISPFENERRLAREIAGDVRFTEVYVDTPLEVAESRDPKGLYKRARAGEIKNFTGIDSPFEPPTNPELVLHGGQLEPAQLADQLYDWLKI